MHYTLQGFRVIALAWRRLRNLNYVKVQRAQREDLERNLTFLASVGSNAPFIGLFGTVIGIILSFKALGNNPKGGLEVVGPGIAEALVATAVGLLVAIPAVVMFNYFKGMLKERIGNTDFLGRIVLARLKHDEGEEVPTPTAGPELAKKGA